MPLAAAGQPRDNGGMLSEISPPLWLWRLATLSVSGLLVGIAALALALGRGAADPPRAGPLLWEDDFKGALTRWEVQTTGGAALTPSAGAWAAEFTGPGQTAAALAAAPAGDFTLEVAGAQTAGVSGAVAYGLVFDWQSSEQLGAALINANGYAEAWGQAGAARSEWFPLKEWPNILVGTASNRVRVDAAGGRLIFRINDELLGDYPRPAGAGGRLGILARSSAAGRVLFSWARVWAPAK